MVHLMIMATTSVGGVIAMLGCAGDGTRREGSRSLSETFPHVRTPAAVTHAAESITFGAYREHGRGRP
jgi:hypothetical protein